MQSYALMPYFNCKEDVFLVNRFFVAAPKTSSSCSTSYILLPYLARGMGAPAPQGVADALRTSQAQPHDPLLQLSAAVLVA
jgi:hypothetical protein